MPRIQNGFSKNDVAAIMAFADCGIDPDDITPRENVLTFRAWKAKGRRVAKGAISQRVQVWIHVDAKDKGKDGNKGGRLVPRTSRLFHISQTVEEDAPKGAKPAAWNNPSLVREGSYDA